MTTSGSSDGQPDLQIRFLAGRALTPDGMTTFTKFRMTKSMVSYIYYAVCDYECLYAWLCNQLSPKFLTVLNAELIIYIAGWLLFSKCCSPCKEPKAS